VKNSTERNFPFLGAEVLIRKVLGWIRPYIPTYLRKVLWLDKLRRVW